MNASVPLPSIYSKLRPDNFIFKTLCLICGLVSSLESLEFFLGLDRNLLPLLHAFSDTFAQSVGLLQRLSVLLNFIIAFLPARVPRLICLEASVQVKRLQGFTEFGPIELDVSLRRTKIEAFQIL